MKIFVEPYYASVKRDMLYNKTAVVIDALRASATIITALENGCDRIFPSEDMERAIAMAHFSDEDSTLLCGEHGSQRISGFALGNSPSEYTREVVAGKQLVMTTSNGTNAIISTFKARKVFIGSFTNASAVAHRMCSEGDDVVIALAGENERCSVEDLLAAGCIISRLRALCAIDTDDLALVAEDLYSQHKSGKSELFRRAKHYKQLVELGFESDLEYCFREDISDVVPVYSEGVITAN